MLNWQDLLVLLVFPVVRSVAGWAQHALEDNVISPFEWKELVATVIRVGSMALAAYLGLNGAGIDISALGASAGAFVADYLFRALKFSEVTTIKG